MVDNQMTLDLGGAFSMERIMYALRMTALGMVAIFSVLAIIWLILNIFKRVFAQSTNDTPKEIPASPIVEEKPVVITSESDITVAIITAAIEAYIASDEALASEYSGGFRVVSFKRSNGTASWNSHI